MWGRFAAGVVAGFFLSVALVGLVCWLLPGPWQSTLVPGLLAFIPVWIGVICASLKFASARRAWLWLGALAVAGLLLLRVLQTLEWVR
ncbi:hypothetical protein CS053_05815 [Rhodanobacter glycinis]|uniref:DUF4175 domain-containing protein n=1 Tax=Rhodanobacter glycinis TaxID=582702 RepID=A0A5B9DX88_9GAMM|nr:hypothetical protein [Rhodanobacter glycinis]QEE24069.1 hypothetical protein CS053_05815 [Rhodanobacter glycinis]